MKFVLDKKTGLFLPEQFMNRVDASDLDIAVFDWLDKNPFIPRKCSFSTRTIAYEFLSAHTQFSHCDVDLVRDAVAKWYNDNSRIADSATEDAGGDGGCSGEASFGSALGPQTMGIQQSGTIATVSCPEIHKKKKSTTESMNFKDVPEECKNGTCFVQAWTTFYNAIGKNPLLCHGIVVGRGCISGIKYVHAWVEIGDTVIDTTMPIFANGIHRDTYYSFGNIDKDLVFRYDSQQVYEKASSWMTYGPWEDILWNYA